MDKKPRPTPRRSSTSVWSGNGNVDYELLDAIGVESPNESTFDNFDPEPGNVLESTYPSYYNDPDTCPGCGHFHYGKQHTRKDHPETSTVYFGPCAREDCGNKNCNNLSHWITSDYIGQGSILYTTI